MVKVLKESLKPITKGWYIKNVYNELKDVKLGNEESVRRVWQTTIKKYFAGEVNFKTDLGRKHLNTDGYTTFILEDGSKEVPITILLEAKSNLNMESKMERSRVMGQALHYVKNIKEGSAINIPNIVILADKDEVFVYNTAIFEEFVSNPSYKWGVAPSKVFANNLMEENDGELVKDLQQSKQMDSLTGYFKVDDSLDVNDVLNYIVGLATDAKNVLKKHYIKQEDIKVLLEEVYIDKILSKRNKDLDNYTEVLSFIDLLKNKGNIYLNPTKKNELAYEKEEGKFKKIIINRKHYDNFIATVDRNYTQEEIQQIDSMIESLFALEERRKRGDFYTPSSVVNAMYKYNEEAFGKDWASRYVIWDMACGTKNMTMALAERYGISVKNVYSSTLMKEELIASSNYTKGGTAFQFDFLNDGFGKDGIKPLVKKEEYYNLARTNEDEFWSQFKFPASLYIKLYENQPILFFTNPPYASDGSAERLSNSTEARKDVTKTIVKEVMASKGGYGRAVRDLYTQFYYRCLMLVEEFNLTNAKICFLTKNSFLISAYFSKLLDDLTCNVTKFNSGFMINANLFQGIKASWGISYCIWDVSNKKIAPKLDLLELNTDSSSFNVVGEREFMRVTKDDFLSLAVDKGSKKTATYTNNAIVLTSPFKGAVEKPRSPIFNLQYGMMFMSGNSVKYNAQSVAMFNGNYSQPRTGKIVTANNFKEICMAFVCRRVIKATWVTNDDEYNYVKLDDDHSFKNDSIVYTLFDNKSCQASYRDFYVPYQDASYDRVNEWFWHDANYMRKLYSDANFEEAIQDIELFAPQNEVYGKPFVYRKLEEIGYSNLSIEAQEVLKYADSCLEESILVRKEMLEDGLNGDNEDQNNWSLQAWDIGFAQLKKANDYSALPSFKLLQNAIRNLSKKLEGQVYTLGFLPKVDFFDKLKELDIN